MIRLQYASRLFVDITNRLPLHVNRSSQALLLVGDIGRPENPITEKAIHLCSKAWPRVIWVPGKHELQDSFDKNMERCQSLCSNYKNVKCATGREIYSIHGYSILTLPPVLSLEMAIEDMCRIQEICKRSDLVVASYDNPFYSKFLHPDHLLLRNSKKLKGWIGGNGGVLSGMQNGVFCTTNGAFFDGVGVAHKIKEPFFSSTAQFSYRR